MNKTTLVPVVVSVDELHGDRLDEVAGRLRAAGMLVDGVLESTGTVTGRAPGDAVGSFADLDGVEAVEIAREATVGPPGSPVS